MAYNCFTKENFRFAKGVKIFLTGKNHPYCSRKNKVIFRRGAISRGGYRAFPIYIGSLGT